MALEEPLGFGTLTILAQNTRLLLISLPNREEGKLILLLKLVLKLVRFLYLRTRARFPLSSSLTSSRQKSNSVSLRLW